MNDLKTQLEALRHGCGIAQVARTRIEVRGEDRAAFLHNFCTNDIKKLTPGNGCEAFFTNVQGKTIGHGFLFASDDAIFIDSVDGQSEFLMTHLDRYLITEDVTLADLSAEVASFLVGGKTMPTVMEHLQVTVPTECGEHQTVTISDHDVTIARVNMTGDPCCLLTVSTTANETILNEFQSVGATVCEPAAIEHARVENGFPEFGVDISDKNLPQEVDRNVQAISFTKGCYLGQETVARLDALGHVNRVLRRISLNTNDAMPSSDDKIVVDGKEIGWFGTIVQADDGQYESLAYLRVQHAETGTEFDCQFGKVSVK